MPSRWRHQTPTLFTWAQVSRTTCAARPGARASVQVDGCGQDLDLQRAARIAAHRTHHCAPEQSGHRVRRSHGSALGLGWRARSVQARTDGGRTWTNTKSLGQFTGFTNVAFDPTNPNTLYAASMQRERKAYSFVAGGPETGIWKSTDAGATWTQLTQGLPAGDKGRIGISIGRANPSVLYATVMPRMAEYSAVTTPATTWRRTNELQSIPVVLRSDPRRSVKRRARVLPGRPTHGVR